MSAGESYPNLTGPEEARQILDEFALAEPSSKGPYDDITGSHVIWAMGSIERAAEYEDGRFQTNADHIARMGLLAIMMISSSERPELSPGRVAILSLVHELIEAFAYDTPHHDVEANVSKSIRETAGKFLVEEFLEGNELLLNAHHEYHGQHTENARFTKALDVHETVDFAIRTRATTQRKHNDDFRVFARRKLSETVRDHTVHEHTKNLVRLIGRKWLDWGCKPFEGNSDEIIDDIEREIFENLRQQAEA